VRRPGVQLPAQPFVRLELVAVRLDALVLGAGFECSGEQPGVQRAVREEADSQSAQRRDQLQLHGAHGEVVEALLGRQAEEVPGRGG
jgi:hypothetical protein